jgi:hypothetical protein
VLRFLNDNDADTVNSIVDIRISILTGDLVVLPALEVNASAQSNPDGLVKRGGQTLLHLPGSPNAEYQMQLRLRARGRDLDARLLMGFVG